MLKNTSKALNEFTLQEEFWNLCTVNSAQTDSNIAVQFNVRFYVTALLVPLSSTIFGLNLISNHLYQYFHFLSTSAFGFLNHCEYIWLNVELQFDRRIREKWRGPMPKHWATEFYLSIVWKVQHVSRNWRQFSFIRAILVVMSLAESSISLQQTDAAGNNCPADKLSLTLPNTAFCRK